MKSNVCGGGSAARIAAGVGAGTMGWGGGCSWGKLIAAGVLVGEKEGCGCNVGIGEVVDGMVG